MIASNYMLNAYDLIEDHPLYAVLIEKTPDSGIRLYGRFERSEISGCSYVNFSIIMSKTSDDSFTLVFI
jgi:hypothetical protein